MVIDYNYSLRKQSAGIPVTVSFLEQYTSLLDNLKKAFRDSRTGHHHYNTLPYAAIRMKEFVIKNGGYRVVELLAEYEKNAALGDYVSCLSLEDCIIEELKVFRDCWIGMYN